MNQQTFFEKFDVLADAPDGVQKLREIILLLAVQGKLMPQGREDEPAAVLLEKIKVIKERLAKEGKFRKSNFLPPIREDEKYFKLPTGWQWVRFDDICSYIQRGKGPKYVEKSDIPVVSQKCIQWDGFKLDRARFISPSTLEKYNEERFLITGDLLWNSTGTGTIGRVNVYVHEDNSYDKIVADSHVTVIRPILMNSRFFYCWVASPIIQNEIEEMASGTTNQIELNLSTIKNNLVPLPPFDEQKRIVSKVDQLMALCDELEARQQEKYEKRIRLNNAALDKLLTAPTPEEFAQHWQRICDNFDLLYDASETVRQLRQAILKLAVLGKLVQQDPNDEPAEKLLARILAERRTKWEADLRTKGKDPKKAKHVEPQLPKNIEDLAHIPESWMWLSWEAILAYEDRAFKRGPFGSTLTKSFFVESGYKVYEQYCPINDDCSFGRYYITPEKFEELKAFEVKAGDYLVSCSGVTLGRITRVPQEFERGIINQALLRVRINDRIISHQYFLYLFRSPFFQKLLFNNSKGTAIPNVKGVKELKAIPIPLPPLAEQPRIVASADRGREIDGGCCASCAGGVM